MDTMKFGPSEILPLGDPRLRVASAHVEDVEDPAFRAHADRLEATLDAFRGGTGFGRAIAAPQIGVNLRFLAVHLDDERRLLINPHITWHSEDTFTMWDDCMSFPSLLVRVRRFASISIDFTDEVGQRRHWENLDRAHSELLQHEIDHLDGVLAIDHALDRKALVSREAFDAMPEVFRAQVDYVIE